MSNFRQTVNEYASASEPPKWTMNPTLTGAYWENASNADTPAIVWIHDGNVFNIYPPNQNTELNDVTYWVERGMKYYGPLPQPPPMPNDI